MWNWFDEFDRMRRDLDRFFIESPLVEYENKGKRCPAVNQFEDKNKLVTEIELPGVDKKDIKLHIADDHAEIKVEKKQDSEVKDKGYYRYEMSTGSYYRSIPFPVNVDSDKAEAEYKDGILKISMPKLQVEDKKTKYLEIK